MEIKPGIVVDANDLIVRMGDVQVRHATDPVPVALRVVLTGRVRGGSLTARFPRLTFRQ